MKELISSGLTELGLSGSVPAEAAEQLARNSLFGTPLRGKDRDHSGKQDPHAGGCAKRKGDP